MVADTLDPQVHALLIDLGMDVGGKVEEELSSYLRAPSRWTTGTIRNVVEELPDFTPEQLQALGHDSPEVRSFVAQVASAREPLDLESKEQAFQDEIRQRLEVSAGQGTFMALSREQDSYVYESALTRRKSLRRKLTSEKNKDPRSVDWRDSPEGSMELYEWVMTKLIGKGTVNTSWIPSSLDPTGERMAWITSRKYLLYVCEDGNVLAMPDRGERPEGEYLYPVGGGREVDIRDYPGWEMEHGNPLVGKSWKLSELEKLALDFYRDHPKATAREIAHHINTTTDLDGKRPVSMQMIRRAAKALRESGRLRLVKGGDRWRDNHAWVNVPATWRVVEEDQALPLDPGLLGRLVVPDRAVA